MHKAERKRNNKNKMYLHFDLKFSESKVHMRKKIIFHKTTEYLKRSKHKRKEENKNFYILIADFLKSVH